MNILEQMPHCKVYVSCPLSVSRTILDKFTKELVDEYDTRVFYYKQGDDYSDKDLRGADIVVCIMEDNKFSSEVTKLTNGCKKELLLALELKKPIFIGYNPKNSNGPVFYQAKVEDYILKGISGTSGYLEHKIQIVNNAQRLEEQKSRDVVDAIVEATADYMSDKSTPKKERTSPYYYGKDCVEYTPDPRLLFLL